MAIWLAARTARRSEREKERARQRDLFTAAYQAYADYRELPYAIRRRRHDEAAAERVRLSEVLREIQSRLAYYQTWTAAESETVGAVYRTLVEQARKVVGGGMHEAWKAPPITDDSAMNIPTTVIDLSSLEEREKAYVTAFHQHLQALAPWWRRRASWWGSKSNMISPPQSSETNPARKAQAKPQPDETSSDPGAT
ncbi:hypothetical protein [Actinoplanes nipponensis]|uniref:hypothetical protein n=1 Tax=Actinoplanes nipponensis TaxID=135950 RepID=UPI00194119C5|nr:hypothetical protein [Actinoplanes nipponensis]